MKHDYARLWAVARFEFLGNVKRKEFLILTLGLPILVGIIMALSLVPNWIYLQHKMSSTKPIGVGWVDPTGRFHFPDHVKSQVADAPNLSDPLSSVGNMLGQAEFDFKRYDDADAGKKDLLAGTIQYLYVVHSDYLTSGEVDDITVDRGMLDNPHTPPIRLLMQRELIGTKLPDDVLPRVLEPMKRRPVLLTPEGKVVADPLHEIVSQFFLPYGMMMLLLMSLLGSSTYLLRSLSEEKENRIMEILLAAVTPGTLFYGKILGLGLLGLLQVAVWVAVTLPMVGLLLAYVHVPLMAMGFFLIYFGLGYTLYAGLIAGVGAIGSTERESNQILGVLFLITILPMLVMPIILDDLNGVVARVFSFIPFTAPMVMMVRLVKETPPAWDVAVSLLSLAVGIWIVYRLALKVFRMGLLMYGKTPTIKEIWNWISM